MKQNFNSILFALFVLLCNLILYWNVHVVVLPVPLDIITVMDIHHIVNVNLVHIVLLLVYNIIVPQAHTLIIIVVRHVLHAVIQHAILEVIEHPAILIQIQGV